jgi:hypothetical protein
MKAKFVNEAIKHLTPRPVEEVLKNRQKVISRILPKMQDAYDFILSSPIWEPVNELYTEENKIFFDFKSKYKMLDFKINRFISKYSYRYYRFIYFIEENYYALLSENLMKRHSTFEQHLLSVSEFKKMFHPDSWGKKLFKK